MDAKGYKPKKEILRVGHVSRICRLFLEALLLHSWTVTLNDGFLKERQPLWFYTKGFSDEAVNASISVLKYSFFPFVVDTNYTSPLEFKDPPSLLLHRLKPSTTTLFLFILDLYLQQPVCSFVSAWLHCFFCAVAPLSRTLRTTPPPRSEMSHVIVEQLTSFTTDGGPTSPAWTVLWTPQRTASCQQNQSRKTSAYKTARPNIWLSQLRRCGIDLRSVLSFRRGFCNTCFVSRKTLKEWNGYSCYTCTF